MESRRHRRPASMIEKVGTREDRGQSHEPRDNAGGRAIGLPRDRSRRIRREAAARWHLPVAGIEARLFATAMADRRDRGGRNRGHGQRDHHERGQDAGHALHVAEGVPALFLEKMRGILLPGGGHGRGLRKIQQKVRESAAISRGGRARASRRTRSP